MEAQAVLLRGRDPEHETAAPFARLARYAWAGFRDWMPPSVRTPLSERAALGIHAVDVVQWMANLNAVARPAISLGCGLARELWLMGPESVVLMDAYLPALQACCRLAREGELWIVVPREPGRWEAVAVQAPVLAGPVRAICADVCDPPLAAERFTTVMMLNLLDSVHNPHVALGQACALLEPGGHLVLSTPFAWRSPITPPERWTNAYPGALDSAAGLAQDMAYLGAAMELLGEEEFCWGAWSTARELVLYRSAAYLWRRPP